MHRLSTCVLAFASLLSLEAQGIITTVAGNGAGVFGGDGGPAASASLQFPAIAIVDRAGNLIIADTYNYRVRRVDATGAITTIAGTGSFGFSGDSGPAINARLSEVTSVALDASGNLFIADRNNHRIRRVTPSGTINTVAGGGNGGDGGPATSASLNNPFGVVVDSAGNVLIADSGNHRIRKVSTSGTITTVAGNGNAGFSGDGGPATSASLNYPNQLALDSSGNIFIPDGHNNRIRKVSGGIITTIAGNGNAAFGGDGGSATAASLDFPYGVAIDSAGNILIADGDNNRIRRVSASSGVITTVVGTGAAGFSGDGGSSTSASINKPGGVTVDSNGNLLVADSYNHRIRRVAQASCSPSGLVAVSDTSVTFSASGGFPVPLTITVRDNCGNTINTGTVAVAFSNGDPSLSLISIGSGKWAGTWQPKNVQSSTQTVLLSVSAFSPQPTGSVLFGSLTITATLASSTPTPVIGGVTDTASFKVRALGPGTFISIFGSNLATSTSSAVSIPLPTTLGGVQVLVGSTTLPLVFVSSGQINAILPYSLTLNTTLQLVVRNGNSFSAPFSIQTAAASPGVFTVTQSGTGAGIIVNQDNTLNSPSNAAARGSFVVIYCAGLGAVTPSLSDGVAAPANPLSITVNSVVVRINGVISLDFFSGLTPGFAGLYQINVQIPSNSATGSQLPVTVEVTAGQTSFTSPTVTMAIK